MSDIVSFTILSAEYLCIFINIGYYINNILINIKFCVIINIHVLINININIINCKELSELLFLFSFIKMSYSFFPLGRKKEQIPSNQMSNLS